MGVQPTGESILKALIETLEAQEQVKITYTIKERGDDNGETVRKQKSLRTRSETN